MISKTRTRDPEKVLCIVTDQFLAQVNHLLLADFVQNHCRYSSLVHFIYDPLVRAQPLQLHQEPSSIDGKLVDVDE
jgi:hypothetical protein